MLTLGGVDFGAFYYLVAAHESCALILRRTAGAAVNRRTRNGYMFLTATQEGHMGVVA